jgi:hypothetical protein
MTTIGLLLTGGGLCAAGLIIGAIIARRPPS